jgi:hypothetical protein
MSELIAESDYFTKLIALWSQESNRSGGSTEVRPENTSFIKSLGKYIANPSYAKIKLFF